MDLQGAPAPLRLASLLAFCALALLAGGCDGSDGSAVERLEETADEPAAVPAGWRRLTNRRAGFTAGVPAGWRARPVKRGGGSLLVSPDELVTVTLLADRGSGALALPLEEFADRTARALGGEAAGPGRFRGLRVGRPSPFGHAYEAVAVRATGRPRGRGVRERVLVVVARREAMATYVAVARENAERRSRAAPRGVVKRVIRSLRGRPPRPSR